MGPVVRLIGSGIGLASEAIAHHKKKKAEAASQSGTPGMQPSEASQHSVREGEEIEVSDEQAGKLVSSGQAVQVGYNENGEPSEPPPSYEEVIHDEEDWELDEAANESNSGREIATTQEQEQSNGKPDVRKILAQFLSRHPKPNTPSYPLGHIPCPVIIPQQRPRTKSRGFVKAYAPVLSECGISQETWLDFIETFRKASQASPIFSGILIAGHLVGYVPSISAMVASILIQTAATAAIVLHSRSRTNTFLDDINEHFFRPRGLFVLLIKYKGSRNRWSSEPLDISHAVTTSANPADAPKSGNRTVKFKHNLQFASGTSHGEMEIPESAPLIYPHLDNAASSHQEESDARYQESHSADNNKKDKKPGKFKSSSRFVNDYMDRRARAAFHHENPNSTALHAPGAGDHQQFASRYADPTHPASSGSLVALLTGGNVDPKGYRRKKDQAMKQRVGFMRPTG